MPIRAIDSGFLRDDAQLNRETNLSMLGAKALSDGIKQNLANRRQDRQIQEQRDIDADKTDRTFAMKEKMEFAKLEQQEFENKRKLIDTLGSGDVQGRREMVEATYANSIDKMGGLIKKDIFNDPSVDVHAIMQKFQDDGMDKISENHTSASLGAWFASNIPSKYLDNKLIKDMMQGSNAVVRDTQSRKGQVFESSNRRNVAFNTDAKSMFDKNPSKLSIEETQAVDSYQIMKDNIKGASQATLKDLAVTNANISKIQDIRAQLQDPDDKLSKQFGFFNARWKGFKAQLIADPEFALGEKKIKGMISSLYASAGKQLSDGELKIATKAFLPSLEAPVENAEAVFQFMEEEAQRNLDSRMESLTKAGIVTDISKIPQFLSNARSSVQNKPTTPTPVTQSVNPAGVVRYVRDANGRLVRQ